MIELLLFLSLLYISHCQVNNVCLNFEDYNTIRNNSNCWYDFTVDSNVMEIITKNGYPVEYYKVVTADGYVLSVFRIPNLHVSNYVAKKGPVFLQHGWMNSAAIFVAQGRKSLAFALSDSGYDVWLGNFRGSQYSEEHLNYTVKDKEFWNYSADDIGLYDIPAQLDLITKATRQKIIYIGHSLGTAAALMYSSSFPLSAKRTVKLFILLAPASDLSNMKAILFRYFGQLFGTILRLANQVPFVRLISQGSVMQNFARNFCLETPNFMQLCLTVLGYLVTGPKSQIQPHLVPVLFSQVPAGTSFKVTKQIADFKNGFTKYNYGFENIQKYGRFFPPKYDLSKIDVPIFIMYAANDWICTKEDSRLLYKKLPSRVRYGIHEIPESNFNHLDFVYGKDAYRLVNYPILKLLSQITYRHARYR